MLKILTHFAHGVYQTELSKIPDVEFYHVVDKLGKKFDPSVRPTKFWSAEMECPRNIKPLAVESVDPDEFNLMLVHWHPFIQQFRQLWPKLPMIFLEHTWPYKNMPSEVMNWKNIRHDCCEHTMFITPSSREAWGATNDSRASSIYHAIDTDNFPQKTDYSSSTQVMTTTNEFISRDWACGFSVWSKVLGVPIRAYFADIALYGYGNGNIGGVAKGPKTRQEILELLQRAAVYFNPAIMSPVPMSVLEAAAVGTPIVSTAYCEPGTIFKNDEHGIISNDTITLRDGIKRILKDSAEAETMAANAKEVVKRLFAPERFRREWMELFNRIKNQGRMK